MPFILHNRTAMNSKKIHNTIDGRYFLICLFPHRCTELSHWRKPFFILRILLSSFPIFRFFFPTALFSRTKKQIDREQAQSQTHTRRLLHKNCEKCQTAYIRRRIKIFQHRWAQWAIAGQRFSYKYTLLENNMTDRHNVHPQLLSNCPTIPHLTKRMLRLHIREVPSFHLTLHFSHPQWETDSISSASVIIVSSQDFPKYRCRAIFGSSGTQSPFSIALRQISPQRSSAQNSKNSVLLFVWHCMIGICRPSRFIVFRRLISPHIPIGSIPTRKNLQIRCRRAIFNQRNKFIRFSAMFPFHWSDQVHLRSASLQRSIIISFYTE